MAATTLASLNFGDDFWLKHLTAKIYDKVEFLTSGILQKTDDPRITGATGRFVDIPSYAEYTTSFERLTAATDLGVNALSDIKDIGVWLEVGNAWGTEDWIRWIVGTDPREEVANQLSAYIARRIQEEFTGGVLTGVFATTLSSTHSTGATYSGANIDENGVVAAKQLLGDAQDKLTRGVANSKVLSDAVLRKIANYDLVGDTYQSGRIANLLGVQMAADDNLSATASVYPTYFAAPSAAIYGFREGPKVKVERNELKAGGTEYLVLTGSVLIHIPGVKYAGSTKNPTKAQLATGSNWSKVENTKNIPIVELKTL